MAMRFAVIGAGRMGKHHARTLHNLESADLVAVVDANEDAAKALAAQRDCKAFTNVADIINLIDAAVISTPTGSHLKVARPLVEAGKHLIIEKPYCDDVEAGRELIELARKTGSKIFIGHSERFNPACIAISKYDIRPKFIEAHRISPFTFRSADIGVVLDMMIHDIDLVLMMARSKVVEVQAIGVSVIGKHEDICNVRLRFANGCVANITASRLAIKTERKMRIFSDEHYLSIDYAKKCGLVIEKNQNLDIIQMARDMDVDDIAELAQSVDYTSMLKFEELSPDDSKDPLTRQAEAFIDAVTNSAKTLACPVEEGLEAVITANAIVTSLSEHKWDGDESGRIGSAILSK